MPDNGLARKNLELSDETHLSQSAVNDEIATVDKAALVARKEEHRLRLLNSFAKTTSREVDFAAHPLVLVIA
jgi:hypothetical protein